MSKKVSLFDSVTLGDLQLGNRIVMAPMTRSRAGEGDAPDDLNVEYYRQRATAGLIVSEGTYPSKNGKGYCRTPGICTPAQIHGWRNVADAVHAAGGRIVLQIMHCGRIGSRYNKEPDAETIAPSAVRAVGQIYTDAVGMADFEEPRALRLDEIPATIEEFRQATANASAAGMDGVELHCASGYLPMEFLSTGTNRRTDAYGGSVHNRIRFVVETLQAMIGVCGPGRIGMRICPGNPFNDLHDDDPVETYSALLDAIRPMRLAYLHVIRSPRSEIDAFGLARRHSDGPLVLNDSFDLATAAQAVSAGQAAAISFGRYFISNPDLVRRFREGAALAPMNNRTLYTPGAVGYTDYPALG
ncbi:MAG: alkene reductase [Candidatus Binatia bacterium]